MVKLKDIPEQEEVGKLITDYLNNGYDNIIINAPTGWRKNRFSISNL